ESGGAQGGLERLRHLRRKRLQGRRQGAIAAEVLEEELAKLPDPARDQRVLSLAQRFSNHRVPERPVVDELLLQLPRTRGRERIVPRRLGRRCGGSIERTFRVRRLGRPPRGEV